LRIEAKFSLLGTLIRRRWFAGEEQKYGTCGSQPVVMADEAESKRELEQLIRRLVRETGITMDQARFLISILGNDWSSLVREARLLTRNR
jgi:hypothetical protein